MGQLGGWVSGKGGPGMAWVSRVVDGYVMGQLGGRLNGWLSRLVDGCSWVGE